MQTNKNSLRKNGFTLFEILIVVSIIAVLAGSVFFSNVFSQVGKSRDVRRKTELSTLQKLLEDYYNDHNQYLPADSTTVDGFGCKTNPDRFQPYQQKLPCDPQFPSHTYLYINDDSTNQTYRIYALMEYEQDPAVKSNPCAQGCTIGGKTYNYVVTSPNVLLPGSPISGGQCPGDPTTKYCIQGASCVNCGNFTNCNVSCAGGTLYINSQCTITCSP